MLDVQLSWDMVESLEEGLRTDLEVTFVESRIKACVSEPEFYMRPVAFEPLAVRLADHADDAQVTRSQLPRL